VSANPTIDIKLARSSDYTTLDDLSSAITRSYQPVFNKPGSFTVSVPIDAPPAYLFKKWVTCLTHTRNGRMVWSGPCTSIQRSGSGRSVTATFSGWMSELDRRYVWKSEESDLIFTSTVGGLVIKALLEEANAKQDSSGATQPTHLTFGSAFDWQVRTRAYKAGSSYGSNITELLEIEDGCDLYIDYLTRKITTKDPADYSTRNDARFGYFTAPNNLADFQETDDGMSQFNYESVVGSSGFTATADDVDAIREAGVMLENWTTLSDVTDPTILGAYANAALVYDRYGIQTYQVTPQQYGDIPRLHDDFELGEACFISADYHSLQLDQQKVRVFTADVSYDQNGNEIINSLGFSPA
jgi:hypothetical protein